MSSVGKKHKCFTSAFAKDDSSPYPGFDGYSATTPTTDAESYVKEKDLTKNQISKDSMFALTSFKTQLTQNDTGECSN